MPASEKLGFEKAFLRLEKIVEALEQGDLPLERALALFGEGMKISRLLRQQLAEAEKKVMELTRNLDGDLELRPLEPSSEDGDEA